MSVTERGACLNCFRKPLLAVRFLLLLLMAFVTNMAYAQLSPGGPVDFGSTPLGTQVSSTLTFQATTATVVSVAGVYTDGAILKDFQLGKDTCTGLIVPPTTCTITVIFNPIQVGERHGTMLVVDSGNNVIVKTILHGIGQGTNFAMAPAPATALSTAPSLTTSTFTSSSVTADGNGNLFFTDVQNGRILEMVPSGTITSIASLPVTANSSIAIAGDGTLYVSAGSSVYGFLPGNTPVAIATTGTPNITLVAPTGLVIDAYGGLFIADSGTGQIVRYSLIGSGSNYVPVLGLTLISPTGLGIDDAQNLYIADTGNNRIVEINPTNSTVVPATVLTTTGFILSKPQGITFDPAGTAYIADTGNARVLEVTAAGVPFVLTDPGFALTTPTGLRVRVNGDLLITDNALGLVTVSSSTPSVNFPTPTIVGTLDTTDDPLYLSVQSIGNLTASLIVSPTETDPSISTNAFLFATGAACPTTTAGQTTVSSFTVGEVCAYPINFMPTQLGVNKANLVFQTTGPAPAGINASTGSSTTTYTATVPLTGNAISGIASFSLVAAPSVNTVGGSDSLTLTALEANGSTAQYYVGTITFTTTDSTGKFLGGTTYTLTAADQGVLSIPAATGIQFNQTGNFTVSATDGTFSVTSNVVHIVNASSMTLTSSVNPSNVNQSTTFTVTITNASPAATGIVSFYSSGALIGTGTISGGIATLNYAFANPGTFPITAVYLGDTTTEAANAGPLSQVVLYPITSTSNNFTSSVNPSQVNQSTTLTLTLTSAGPTPTGTVVFYSNGVAICTATVVNGVASCPASFTAAGTYQLTAIYSGDGANAPYTAGPLAQVVLNTAAMTLTSSINPSLVSQATTFTATIATSGVAPTGIVSFYSAGVLIGTGTLSGGVATLMHPFANPGTYPITATYAGDNNTVAASAGPLSQVVLYSITSGSGSFTSSVNPSQINQLTTLALALTSNGPTPTGTVKFYSNGVLICTAAVAGGIASCPVSFTPAGIYQLTAVYSGDNANAPYTAGPLQQVVLNTANMALTSSVNPSQINQATVFTATIATSGVPAMGTVDFFSNGALIGTGMLVNGVATIHDSFATCGVYPITATYAGDNNTAAANAGPLSQVVLCSVSNGSTLKSSLNPSLVGQGVVFTATLVSSGPTPTGTVQFFSNGVAIGGLITLSGGAASNPSYIFTAPGTYPITAVYSGDANNAGYTLGPLAQVVNYQPSLTLTSNTNPVLINAKTQLTATLSSAVGGIAATGTVSFYDGGVLIGTGSVANGQAGLMIGFATIGLHPLTAIYNGDTNYAKATSNIYQQDVVDPTAAVLTTSINPSLVGQSVPILVTITSAAPTITGLVTFLDGGVQIGTANVGGTTAVLNYVFSTAGTHQLTCSYAGDIDNAASTCSAYAQVVTSQSAVTLVSAVNPSNVNQSVAFTATVSATGHTPNGTVTFYNSNAQFATIALTGGQAQAPYTFNAVGTYPMKAVYSGDSTTAAGTSNVVNQLVVNPITFTLSSSVNPVNVNATVTFTATGSGFTGTAPTGSVQFFSNGVLLGMIGVGVGVPPTASLPTSFATIGTDSVTCIYSGDMNYARTPCTAPVAEVVVNPTNSVLTINPNPVLLGSSTTLTATVTSTGGNIPAGMVTFTDGGVTIGTGGLSAGVANLPYVFTTTGAHNLSCTYAGDGSDAPSTCNIVALDVVQPTVLTLHDTPNPSTVNQTVTFTTAITSSSTQPFTGTLKIYNGSAVICSTTVGGPTCTYAFPLAGTYPITAVYSGDAYHSAATSNIVPQVVLNLATIVLTSSPNPVLVNNLAVLTVVATSTGPTPTGVVSFYDGNAPIGNANLAAGTAVLTVTFPGGGIHTLTAIYAGDPVTAPAISNTVSQTVADYSLAVTPGTPSSFTGIAGSTASYSLTLTPLVTSNLISNVTFSVDALPTGMTATFTPTSVATGSGSTAVALTLLAPPLSRLEGAPQLPSRSRLAPIALALLLLPIAFIRKRKKMSSLLLLILLAVGFTGLTGCITSPSSGYYGQVQQTYNLTVNATSGNLTRTTTVTFIVQ